MILAIDTSTAACTAALLGDGGDCIDNRDEQIGRGHSERLVPMIAELLAGRVPDRILVGVGPGSFTGIRVGIAAAYGLAIGWDVDVQGLSSPALLAAGAESDQPLAAAMQGGHGELFVQQFASAGGIAESDLLNLPPERAAERITADLVVGPGAADLVRARGWGTAILAWPSAANAMKLPPELRSLAARPVYARGPDAGTRRAA